MTKVQIVTAFLLFCVAVIGAQSSIVSINEVAQRVEGQVAETLGIIEGTVDCGSEGAVLQIAMSGRCTQVPCALVSGETYQMNFTFLASAASSALRFKLEVTSEDQVYPIDDVGIDGSIEPGRIYVVSYNVPVSTIFLGKLVVWRAEVYDAPSERKEVCVSAGAHIVEAEVTEKVFMEITIGGEIVGNVTIGLFGTIVPLTAKNFEVICTEGINGSSYAGAPFHRVIQRFMIQGGDIVNHDGTGAISIYGPRFDDENFILRHSGPGWLSMANAGANTNGCQFFITTVVTPWLDGAHVVFGKVLDGMDVVTRVETNPTDGQDRPIARVLVNACGAIVV